MESINKDNIILEKEVFLRSEIEKRMTDGGFNSLSTSPVPGNSSEVVEVAYVRIYI